MYRRKQGKRGDGLGAGDPPSTPESVGIRAGSEGRELARLPWGTEEQEEWIIRGVGERRLFPHLPGEQ